MACDLECVYGELAARLPDDAEAPVFHLDESVIPAAPAELATDRICIRRGQIQRLPGCRGDQLNVIAPSSTIRQLGLLFLAVLFHERCDRSMVRLTRSDSSVKYLVTEYRHFSKSEVSGFRWRPWVFGYVPDDVGHTFTTEKKGFAAPVLRLTNVADRQNNEQDWQNRDVLHWGGGGGAMAELAGFLLNAGRPSAPCRGFTIPPNETFFTAEVRFWIPEEWERQQRSLADIQKQHGSLL